MKDQQLLQETYADLLHNETDPALLQLIQDLDSICNAPQPPTRLNWVEVRVMHTEQTFEKRVNILPFRARARQGRFLKHARILVAAIVLVLVLVGVGAVAPISNRLGGNQTAHAYTQVNQMQQDQDVKFTLLGAYASSSVTILVTAVQIGNERGHLVVPDGTLTYQQENLEISSASVFVAHVSHPNFSCQFYSYSAAHPPVDARTVTLIWHVDQISIGQLPLTRNPGQTIHGNWTFQFTILFHHDTSSPDTSTIDLTQC
jgi:hypothetical protein